MDQIPNYITRKTPASFEPAIDYVVVKVPRWDFEKFPGNDHRLTSQMKSVGEAMGIGRTFKEALNKTLRSLENGWSGFHARDNAGIEKITRPALMDDLRSGTPERILKIWQALILGMTPDEISRLTGIDIWFLENLRQLVEFEGVITREYAERSTLRTETLRKAKRMGFSDKHIGLLTGKSGKEIRSIRKRPASCLPTKSSTPARRSSSPSPRTTTRPTTRKPSRSRPPAGR